MFKRNKRVLWLLNHRTLMPYEVPLLLQLGFEVFVPKLFPKFGYRSAILDTSYDASLSLPPTVLETLNKFNFYEDEWTSEITALVNRYFGTAFIIPQARLTEEAVDNFEGQLIFRTFGLSNGSNYTQFLEDLHGPLVLRKIKGIKERFWFGESYDNLHECEESVFVERALFLPIGIPDSLFSTAQQWTGMDKKILFVCPNAVTDAYYSGIYKKFKQDFGDFPHVIVGAQDVPVPDPHVLGFVTDEELRTLFLECAVLYYHSTETRHLHYHPIEAVINGMPIVFYEGSLLDRMGGGRTKGRVSTVEEARFLVGRLLAGDKEVISELTEDQQTIAHQFSDDYCRVTWKQQMERRGFLAALGRESTAQVLWKEIKRALLLPWAQGRTKIDPHKNAVAPPKSQMSASEAEAAFGSSLFGGVLFNTRRYPDAVHYVSGVGPAESWGRWSNGRSISIVAKHLLQGKFRLFIRAVGYGENAGAAIPVTVGSQTRTLRLKSDVNVVAGSWLHFDLAQASNVIEIGVPHPTNPTRDTRFIGVGLIELRAAPPVTLDAAAARETLGSSLADGLDFSVSTWPAFVDMVEGLAEAEPWGRWSTGSRVRIELNHTLEGRFRLLLRAVGYGPNIGVAVAVTVGKSTTSVQLPSALESSDELSLEFNLPVPSNIIEFVIPHPTCPPGDGRSIGIGFFGLRSAPILLS